MSGTELDTTVDQWREELGRHEDVPGHTARELARELGFSKTTMRDRLRKLIDEGRCIVKTGSRLTLQGIRIPVPVYQITNFWKGKK